jgi:hypothetical protein
MAKICEIVTQALDRGYLSVDQEEQLRSLLRDQYDSDDLAAFVHLQDAAMSGEVTQESWEQWQKKKPRK